MKETLINTLSKNNEQKFHISITSLETIKHECIMSWIDLSYTFTLLDTDSEV